MRPARHPVFLQAMGRRPEEETRPATRRAHLRRDARTIEQPSTCTIRTRAPYRSTRERQHDVAFRTAHPTHPSDDHDVRRTAHETRGVIPGTGADVSEALL